MGHARSVSGAAKCDTTKILPMSTLTKAGERIDPWCGTRTHEDEDHVARYLFARRFTRGTVLDIACASGYGTAILVDYADRIVGMDVEERALAEARERIPAATFQAVSAPPIPVSSSTFDTIVTFETIEHIEDDAGYARELARILKPDGKVLLSTPNKEVTSPDGPPPNTWHVREYRLDDLRRVLEEAGLRVDAVYSQGGRPRSNARDRLALKVVARFPVLCRPGRFWDRWAHGTAEVEPFDGSWTPKAWLLVASPLEL